MDRWNVCFLYFRFVDRLHGGAVYTAFCFLIRSIAAIGGALLNTSAYSILTTTFKDHIPIVIVSLYFFCVDVCLLWFLGS